LDADEWCAYLLRNPHGCDIPSFIILAQAAQTFVPSSAQIEQHFSVLNRIKTIRCSQMLLDLFNSLSRVRINGDQRTLSVQEIDIILEKFLSMKKRRNREGNVLELVSPQKKLSLNENKRCRIDEEEDIEDVKYAEDAYFL
jgi:hypothetical protein